MKEYFSKILDTLVRLLFSGRSLEDSIHADFYELRYNLPDKKVFGEGEYAMYIMYLASSVMKANGAAKKVELNEIKKFFIRNFGERETAKLVLILREALTKRYLIERVCVHLKNRLEYASCIHIYHFMYKIARADGLIDTEEEKLVEEIAVGLGINKKGRDSVRALFAKHFKHKESKFRPKRQPATVTSPHHDILGVEVSATQEEIKNAFREKAKQHHPDKVSHLGEGHVKIAEDRFREIAEAYDALKTE